MNAIAKTAALLLPAIIPSWRFFKDVAPSPRVEVALVKSAAEKASCWREFRPRPQKAPLRVMLRRLFWNAPWNESLYLVSLAERLVADDDTFCQREITDRLRYHLRRRPSAQDDGAFFLYRIVFVSHDEGDLIREVGFVSQPEPLSQ